jgi:hypothetical protein
MAHVFDLADNWPADHVSLIVQGWYAIPTDDGGADEDYGVWNPGDQAAWHAANPSAYPAIPYTIQDASTCNGGQRFIGSKLRPLTGLYSDTGKDAASIAHIDRMLGVIPRDGDPRGRIDTICCTVGNIQYTSYGGLGEGDANFKRGLDNRYRHLDKMLERAEAAGLTNCVSANYEAYYLWNYLDALYPTTLAKLVGVALDLQALVVMLLNSSAGFKVDGRVVIYWYEGDLGEDIPATGALSWTTIMEEVRKPYDAGATPLLGASSPYGTGHDFFIVGRNHGAGDVPWLDGMYPWIRYQDYLDADGDAIREKAANWAQDSYTAYIQPAVAANAGRVGMANFSPGMEDYVLGWGTGQTDRAIPRSTETIKGQFDGYQAIDDAGERVDGLVIVTWNGYPEGHCLEPTVTDNGEFLGLFTEQMALYKGETPDSADTDALLDIWRTATKTITCPAPYRQSGRQVASRSSINLTSGGPA